MMPSFLRRRGYNMNRRLVLVAIAVFLALFTRVTFAYDCAGLPEWKRQHYYLSGAQVQYQGTAYENTIDGSKRDRPGETDNWLSLGACDTVDGGGGVGAPGDAWPVERFHCHHIGVKARRTCLHEHDVRVVRMVRIRE